MGRQFRMFKRKKKMLGVALAATLAVSLTACSTPSSSDKGSTDKPATTAASLDNTCRYRYGQN